MVSFNSTHNIVSLTTLCITYEIGIKGSNVFEYYLAEVSPLNIESISSPYPLKIEREEKDNTVTTVEEFIQANKVSELIALANKKIPLDQIILKIIYTEPYKNLDYVGDKGLHSEIVNNNGQWKKQQILQEYKDNNNNLTQQLQELPCIKNIYEETAKLPIIRVLQVLNKE